MGGKLSPNIDLDIDGGLDLDVSLPTSYTISIGAIPPIDLNVRPLDMTIRPLDLSLRMKEIPSIRAHFPLDYQVGFTLLGLQVACVRLCGHGQAITEPYEPYPCEPQPLSKMPDREQLVDPRGVRKG